MPRGRPPKKNKFEKFRLERDPTSIYRKTSLGELGPMEGAPQHTDTPDCMGKDANLDSYSDLLEKTPEGQLLEKNFEIEELNVRLSNLTSENQRLTDYVERLKIQNRELTERINQISKESVEPYENRITELEARIQELLQSMNRVSAELREKEKMIVDKQTQLDTIKHSYTQTGYKNMPMRGSGFVQSMNGYQDWN